MTRLFRVACLTGLAVAIATPALANSRPPAPTQIHFSPGSTQDIYLQATFGLLESHDSGATWTWVCEEAIGYSGLYDPDYTVSSKGSLLATTFDGLKVRRDGCTFEPTNLGTEFATAVASDAAGDVLYAAVADAMANDHKIYKSTDDGKTFVPTGATTPGDEASWSSIEVAPSNANVVYAAGYRIVANSTPPRVVTLYKSTNAGVSWSPLSINGVTTTKNSDLIIGSISPDDPNFFLLAVTFPVDANVGVAVYRTINGGATFTPLKTFADYVPGMVIRKLTGAGPASSKAEVVIGTQNNGIFDSLDGGQTFTQSSVPPASIHVECMGENAGTLWACGDNLPPDSMALGKSATAGNWTKVLEFKDIKSVTQCPAGTIQHDTCDLARWCTFRDQIGIAANPTGCISQGADASLVDGSPADASGGGGGGKKGCCDAGGSPAGAIALSLCAVVPLFRRRGRRGRRA